MLTILAVLQIVAADPAAAIHALRRESNAAIAAHDAERLRPLMMPDYAGLPGSSGRPLGLDETLARLGRAFADPTFVTYVRTPMRIRTSSSRKRAVETGAWLGTWRKPDGLMRVKGVYQAYWVPFERRWRLQNESFVTLRCAGSRSCSEVD